MKKILKNHWLTIGAILLGVSCLVAILTLALDPAARKGPFGFGPPAPMITFTPKDKSFSILYPENWSAFETPNGNHGDHDVVAVIIVAGQFYGNLSIARQDFPNGNINQVITWGQSRDAKNKGYAPLQLTQFVGRFNESTQEFTWNAAQPARCQDLFVYSENIGYALTFCSYETKWQSLQSYFVTMMKSFAVPGK